MAQVQIGQPVPDFTLPDSNGNEISLGGFRGQPVVLYFYPKDMTPGCTAESCDFRDAHADFSGAGAVVLGISPDPVKSHEKFAAKFGLPFPLLADTDHKVCELFDVWKEKSMYGKKYMGVERSTFLVDKHGTLVKEWRKVKVAGHVAEVLNEIKKLAGK
ncbi:MAG TPA: thioredoxin-dependent thiol peroxidase [Bacilli bacterium]